MCDTCLRDRLAALTDGPAPPRATDDRPSVELLGDLSKTERVVQSVVLDTLAAEGWRIDSVPGVPMGAVHGDVVFRPLPHIQAGREGTLKEGAWTAALRERASIRNTPPACGELDTQGEPDIRVETGRLRSGAGASEGSNRCRALPGGDGGPAGAALARQAKKGVKT